ncbi:hypothetical protein ACHAWU_009200 [Discostella pseudostelligera]|uniref:non-specific serine/threonine protein kinase n=1 Tax=Discostella pseudostelligera TaxID=259834 RepID=A0ABD3MHE1_9STRA
METPPYLNIVQYPKRMRLKMGNCSCQQRVEPNSSAAREPVRIAPKLISLDTRSCSSPRRSATRSSQSSLSHPDEIRQQKQHQPEPQTKSTTFYDNYQLLPDETLGHGIAGIVHKCIHRSSSKVYAVKIITKSKVRCKNRIQREIAILHRVQKQHHPNIIELYDVYEDETTVHIVTELCRGGELYEEIIRLKESSRQSIVGCAGRSSVNCFHERDAAHIINELLSAVSSLHSINIVHRDLKPENILLVDGVKERNNLNSTDDLSSSPTSSSSLTSSSSQYTIKLIDFGLSTRHTTLEAPLTSVVGTSYYMAPEVLAGSHDRTCDLWSVGVITFAMLTGRPPFNGVETNEIVSKIRNCQVEMEKQAFWDGVPNEKAKDFIQCLMMKDPQKRYTADMALGHPWIKEFTQLEC